MIERIQNISYLVHNTPNPSFKHHLLVVDIAVQVQHLLLFVPI